MQTLPAIFLFFASLASAALAQSGGFEGQFGGDPFGEQGRDPVVATAQPSATTVAPGGGLVIAFTLDHAPGFHSWPAKELGLLPDEIQASAINTEFGLAEPADWIGEVYAVQWPAAHDSLVPNINGGDPVEVPTFDGEAVIYLPVLVADDAPAGTHQITVSGQYQACDEAMCLMPQFPEFTFEITVDPAAPAAEFTGAFAGFDPAAFELPAPRGVEAAPAAEGDQTSGIAGSGNEFYGIMLPDFEGPFGLVLLAILSALGGFVLNLTPCVLPVIPIKIMTLSQHAGSPGKSFVLGLWMALGVVAFWVGIGIPAAFVAQLADPSIMFGIWWITAGIGLVIALMALGLMGLFTITLPQKTYMVNPEADSPAGSFLFGVMTAVLGLPCFGFVAGALLPAASTLGPLVTMTVFACMGIGMAAPYLVLSANPKWIDKLPRTGPASELVKHVMGLLLLAAAAYFVGSGIIALVSDYPVLAKKIHYWVIAIIGLIAGGLLLVQTFKITKKAHLRAVFSLVGLVIGFLGVAIAASTTSHAAGVYAKEQAGIEAAAGSHEILTTTWVKYTEPALQRTLDEGKVAVLDFTAEWCLNCKALKATVLNVNPVRPVLESDGVVMFKVDLTSRRSKGWGKLREFGRTGIPTLVIMGGDLDEPWIANAYGRDDVMSALRDAGAAAGDALATAQ